MGFYSYSSATTIGITNILYYISSSYNYYDGNIWWFPETGVPQ